MKMKKGKTGRSNEIQDLGIFNIIVAGDSPYSISIADGIKSKFASEDNGLGIQCQFNIVEDIED